MSDVILDLESARALMLTRGYEWVKTAGGPVAIDEWEPYAYPEWRGRSIANNAILDEVPDSTHSPESNASGIWRFSKRAE